MRIEMDVRIDEARQKREAAQVAGCGDRFAAAHVRDLAVGNDDRDVRNRAAFAVEGRSGAKRDGFGLGGGIDGRERDNDDRAKNSHGGSIAGRPVRKTCRDAVPRNARSGYWPTESTGKRVSVFSVDPQRSRVLRGGAVILTFLTAIS